MRHDPGLDASPPVRCTVEVERGGWSQNEAPVWECDECSDNAAWICTFCMYEKQNPFYCELHAEDHDCDAPEMLLPVVNSPRMGMCAYSG